MSSNQYQYVIELFREDNSPLGQASVEVDWGPAEEWARLEALRKGHISPDETGRIASIEPIWLHDQGEPHVEGFRVLIDTEHGGSTTDFSKSYFKNLASRAANQLIESGRLQNGEQFRYMTAAFRQPSEQRNSSRLRFTTEEIAPALSIKKGSLSERIAGSIIKGTKLGGEVAAFIPKGVLDEAAALTRQTRSKETGGILIGHLYHDETLSEIFVDVTAQIHARHTESALTSLTFTTETWTEVRAAIDLRRKEEIMVGWWHSHPVREWCKDCTPDRQRVCSIASDFFSAHDQALHRTIFPRAYSIALVANDAVEGDVTFSAFGWRQGILESRGYSLDCQQRERVAIKTPECGCTAGADVLS